MEIQESAVSRPKQTGEAPKPNERLTDEQMGNLLAAFGNNESKAATLLLMRPETIYTMYDIHKTFMSSQGENPGWKINWNGPFSYCRNSLAPIGLVARETIDETLEAYGYVITNYGEKIGKPLAGLLLDFSQKYPDISLADLFGGTASRYSGDEDTGNKDEHKKRSPLTRYRIYYELTTATSFPMQTERLAEAVREDSKIVGGHLGKIGERGIIDYDSTEPTKPVSSYSLRPDHPDQNPVSYRGRGKLTQWVYNTLLENPDRKFRIKDLEELYAQHHNGKLGIGEGISSVLAHLRRGGYANVGGFSYLQYSEINIAPEKMRMLIDLVVLLDAFQNQSPEIIERGNQFVNYFLTHPKETASLMQKAKEHSPMVNRRPIDETFGYILSVVQTSPDITISDIRKILKDRYQIYMQRPDLWAIAKKLVKDDRLQFRRENGRNKYRLPAAEESSI